MDHLLVAEALSMNDLKERLLDSSTGIIHLTKKVDNSEVGLHVAKQIPRSSTSPLANHGEAQAAESNKDFIHKLKSSLTELRETRRWLTLIERVPLIERPELLEEIVDETDQLIRIFVSSINTAHKKAQSA